MWSLDGEAIQELEQWSDSTAKLQALVGKANWADAGCKDFAEHLCEDLHRRIQRYKALLAKKLEKAEGKKPQLQGNDPAAEEIVPLSLNLANPKPRRIAGKKRQRGDCNGRIMKKIVTRKLDDGHQWRKYGQKAIRNSIHPKNYFKCYEKTCPALKFVQRSDTEPDQFDITYKGKHTCGDNHKSDGQPPAQHGQVQNVVLVVSEKREQSDNASNSVHLSHHSFVRIESSTSVGHINPAQHEQRSKRATSLQKAIEIIQAAPQKEQQVDQQSRASTSLSIWRELSFPCSVPWNQTWDLDTIQVTLQDIPEGSGGKCIEVQKRGSVGRFIDVTRFKDYHELRSAILCLFRLEEQLDDPTGSEWKLFYLNHENDVHTFGDDPWEEFVQCVRCIKILSRSELGR